MNSAAFVGENHLKMLMQLALLMALQAGETIWLNFFFCFSFGGLCSLSGLPLCFCGKPGFLLTLEPLEIDFEALEIWSLLHPRQKGFGFWQFCDVSAITSVKMFPQRKWGFCSSKERELDAQDKRPEGILSQPCSQPRDAS